MFGLQSDSWLSRPGYEYDPVGRVTALVAGDGGTTRLEYTARGELARETDPLGASVSYAYDPLGALVEVTDANGATTRYGYDLRGNRTSRTDASGAVQTWEYDLADQVVAVTDPLGRSTRYTRDDLGRVVREQDASGRTQTLTLDPAGRVASRTWGDGTTDTFDYDAIGRPVRAAGAAGETTYAYDASGNLTEVTDPAGRTVATAYDPAGRPTATTYPDGTTGTYTYDAAGRLDTVVHPGVGETTHTWDHDGRLVAEDLPGGQQRIFTYDAAGRLAGYDQDIVDAVRRTDLTHDLAGRITGETTDGQTTSYGYNRAGQLLSTQGPDRSATYAYDQLGRRTSATIDGAEFTYAYDAAGQLLTETVDGAVREYGYDAAGRRTAVSDADGNATEHAYDARGLLAKTTETAPDGTTTVQRRTHDAVGQLLAVATTADGATSTTQLTWDSSRAIPQVLALETDGVVASLVYGTRRLAAVGVEGSNGLFATDIHGSTIATPATAALAAAGGYDAWGNPLGAVCEGKRPTHPLAPGHCAGDAAGGNPPDVQAGRGHTPTHPRDASDTTAAAPGVGFGYRGELHVDGLVHLRARDYDPTVGGFTTVDPLEGLAGTPTVANPYHYADNDPLNKIDPTGLRPDDRQLRAAGTTWATTGSGWDDTAWGTAGPAGLSAAPSTVAPWTPQRCVLLYGSCGSVLTDMGRGFSNFSAGIVDHVVLGTVDFLVPDRWATTGRIGPLYSGDTYLPSYNVGTWTGVATDVAAGGRAVVGAARRITGAVRSAGSLWGATTGAASRAATTARSWADNTTSTLRSLFRRPAPRSPARPRSSIEPGGWAQAPNQGFLFGWRTTKTLKPGTIIDRYGRETGRFFSPAGTSFGARSLPPGSGPLNAYEVVKPLPVDAGVAAPAWGQPGYGIQYRTEMNVADLIRAGFLKPAG